MLKDGKNLYALEVEGTRFDTGNQFGLLKANLAFAMKDPETNVNLKEFFRENM